MTTEGTAAGRGRAVLAVSLFYFLYFGALACVTPFLSLYYRRIGLSGVQIGALMAIPPLVMPLVSVLWGMLSDSLRWRGNLLCLAALGTILPMLLLPLSDKPVLLGALTFVYAAFAGPIAPLADSMALEAATKGWDYGRMRLWGSLGYVVAAWSLGQIIERTSLRWLFYGYAALVALGFLVALQFPPRRPRWASKGLPGLRLLLADRTLVIFLGSVFFLSASVAAMEGFFGLYLDGIGARPGLLGLAVAIAALSEVPVMFVSGRLIRHLTARGLYVLGFAAFVLRFALYSAITSPPVVLAVQALHGLSYASYFVGGVVYTNERAPAGLSATAQALFSGTAYGVGAIAGSLAGGYLYDMVGMAGLFRVCSAVSAAALLAFLLVRPARAPQSAGC